MQYLNDKMMNVASDYQKLIISKRLMVILFLLLLLHILLASGIVKADFVWGGRYEGGSSQLVKNEITAAVITVIMLLIVSWKKWLLERGKKNLLCNILLWLMVVFFLFNFIANTLSESTVEMIIFLPVSLIMAVGCITLNVSR